MQTEQFIADDCAAPELMQDAREAAMLTIEDSSFAVFLLEVETGKAYDVVGVAKDNKNLCIFVTRYTKREHALYAATQAILNEYSDCIPGQDLLETLLPHL